MTEEKKSLLQRILDRLFAGGEAKRADQKERRNDLSGFMEDHARDTKQALADQEQRFADKDKRG